MPSANSRAPQPMQTIDRRLDERFVTLYRVARVLTDDGAQHLCLIRNIGSGGLMLETYTPFGQGTHVQVEPKGCAPIGGRIAWVKDKHAGVAFDAPIDVGTYLQPHHLHVKLHTPRSPRLTVLRRARLRVGPMWHVVQLLDLSQKGAKVESDLPIEMDESVELMVDGLPTVSGHVRWVQEARAGIEFSRAIPLPDLAEWARSLSGDAEAQSA